MAKLKISNHDGFRYLSFHCPGCGVIHTISTPRWGYNDNDARPTITPSIKVTGGGEVNYCCHSFISNGFIQFLADCTHELAGQTVELLEWV